MSTQAPRLAALGLAALALSCGGEAGEPPDRSPAPPHAAPQGRPPGRNLRDVLDAKLALHGIDYRAEVGTSRELRSDDGVLPPGVEPEGRGPEEHLRPRTAPDLDPDLVEFRDGLAATVQESTDARERARGDVAALGDEMVPVLAAGIRDRARPAEERKVLVDLAASVPHGELGLALVDLAGQAEEAWLRRYALWALEGHRSAAGADAVLPRLMLRMKYEPDGEALGWLLRALWAFGNTVGLERGASRAADLADPAGRATLEASLSGYEGLEAPPALDAPSEALLAEVWLWISDLSGEHYQMRGVDDARYVLSGLMPWVAGPLAEALEDDDSYVRLHAAQVLERMGPRGDGARASLVLSLEDPSGAVRGAAAEALVAVAGDGAGPALEARLGAEPAPSHHDRVALTRALARLPGGPPAARLRAVFEGAVGSDLRLAAAEGLLRVADPWAMGWLAEEMTGGGDPAGAETAVERWLRSEPDGEALPFDLEALAGAWRALAPPGQVIHTAEQARARRAGRAAALTEAAAAAKAAAGR